MMPFEAITVFAFALAQARSSCRHARPRRSLLEQCGTRATGCATEPAANSSDRASTRIRADLVELLLFAILIDPRNDPMPRYTARHAGVDRRRPLEP